MLIWTESEISLNQMGAKQTLAHYQIVRRYGSVVPFEPSKIADALMKAFLGVYRISTEQNKFRQKLRQYANWITIHLNSRKYPAQGRFLPKNEIAQFALFRSNGFFFSGKTNLRNAP